jgi:hypothetical protein
MRPSLSVAGNVKHPEALQRYREANHEAQLGDKRLSSHKGMFDGYVDLSKRAMGQPEGEAKEALPHVHEGEDCGCTAEE